MESWCLSYKRKSWLLITMMLLLFMVVHIQSVCIEDERNALLEIKASLYELSDSYDVNNLLSTWVDQGNNGTHCCNWERIKCDTTGYITHLSLSNMLPIEEEIYDYYGGHLHKKTWSLNVLPFLHFKELRSLDLSWNYIDNTIVTGMERLSSLKKLEMINLSSNYIETSIFPSLGSLTSLKVLNLSHMNGYDGYNPPHDILEVSALKNLEVLDLTGCGYHGTLQMQGSNKDQILRKLKILNLADNYFNESLITSLSALPSLTILDLSFNSLSKSFPLQGCKCLMKLKNLESISLSSNNFNKSIVSCLSFIPSLKMLDLSFSNELGSSFPMQEFSSLRELTELNMKGCGFKSLKLNGTMSNLKYLNLDHNKFNDDIMMSMAAFPSLRFLSLESSFAYNKRTFVANGILLANGTMSKLLHLNLDNNYFINHDIMRSMAAFPSLRFLSLMGCMVGGQLFANEMPNLPYLEVLILRGNGFNGTLPSEAWASFSHLKVLDLGWNNFVGRLPSIFKSLSSLEVVLFDKNVLNGTLNDNGMCELKNLRELDLSHNMFDGNIPECFNRLSSLKFFDISSNQFTGVLLPSLFTNLTSLEYVDFSRNKFEGAFSFSWLANHTKLEFFQFEGENDKFKIETQKPIGWIPKFQLKVLVLSNWNIERPKGSGVPSFLLHQHELRVLDLSHNSLKGHFPNWLLNNNKNLEVLKLRNNSFHGVINIGYKNANIRGLDLSGNRMTGNIQEDLAKFIPRIEYLNFSGNSLNGVIPSSIGDLSKLDILDLSSNEFRGEVPKSLLTNWNLEVLILSNNKLYGHILSGNLSLGRIGMLLLNDNYFTGNIGNVNVTGGEWWGIVLDISDNSFMGTLPSWISNMPDSSELVVRNNRLEGQFPCGKTAFSFLDISQNSFSGPIPSCLNLQHMEHLHLGSNRFTGLIPDAFRNLTEVLTLDIGHNYLSGSIPKFIGELSNLRILNLGKNNFSGSIPKQLCQLNNASLIDLSNNSLSGLIPRCLQNITGPKKLAYIQESIYRYDIPFITYRTQNRYFYTVSYQPNTQDEAQFTTKSVSHTYIGNILDYMSGLDLSCNKLTGEIPQELGMLTQVLALNLSHNHLSGPIPVNLSKLAKIESLDLSSNLLTGKVPSELLQLNFLSVFNVSYNSLSGKLPEYKAQFATFTNESYEGNPLLCGLPLENKCTGESRVTHRSKKEESDEKWYDMDMVSFYGSASSTWFVFMFGFATILYINPYWRRRWLDLIEDCLYTCYFFFYDLVRKVSMLFYN